MQACAERGILCVLLRMPGNLAVLDENAADGVAADYPEIDRWYIGGHSLGGAMAARYAAARTWGENELEGLVAAAEGRASGQRNGGGDTASDTPDRPERGRFGAPVPRAPDEDVERYAVDFDIGGGRFATITLEYGWTVEQVFAASVVAVSRKCPNNELPKGVPVRLKAWSAAIWLIMRGSFFWHSDYRDFATCMFLDRDAKSCTLMRIMSDEFFAFVAKNAKLEDVDPKKGDLAKVLGLVKQIAVNEEYSRGVRPGNSWERRGDAVYISSGDTEMCRIDAGGA
jgi:pimeloyl-ACP methyl ester carboxylesterase